RLRRRGRSAACASLLDGGPVPSQLRGRSRVAHAESCRRRDVRRGGAVPGDRDPLLRATGPHPPAAAAAAVRVRALGGVPDRTVGMSGHHVPEAGVVAATHLSGEEAQSGIVGIDQLRAAGARGGAMSVIAQAAKALLGFGGTIVLARLLTPADFGLVAMVVAVTGFLSLFREMG